MAAMRLGVVLTSLMCLALPACALSGGGDVSDPPEATDETAETTAPAPETAYQVAHRLADATNTAVLDSLAAIGLDALWSYSDPGSWDLEEGSVSDEESSWTRYTQLFAALGDELRAVTARVPELERGTVTVSLVDGVGVLWAEVADATSRFCLLPTSAEATLWSRAGSPSAALVAVVEGPCPDVDDLTVSTMVQVLDGDLFADWGDGDHLWDWDLPDTYGDGESLDALWDACEAGDDDACDELYWESPYESAYEELALTCGGRREAERGRSCTHPEASRF
jgi:hypothetical protein